MQIRHINTTYFSFSFENLHENADTRVLTEDFLKKQTELFYIVAKNGIYDRDRQIIACVLDKATITWLKLLC